MVEAAARGRASSASQDNGKIYRARAVVLSAERFSAACCTSARRPRRADAWASPPTPAQPGAGAWAFGWPASRPARRPAWTPRQSTTGNGAAARRRANPNPSPSLPRIDCRQLPCWITETTPELHAVVRANLHRAPMYTGQIQSTGPRYCPSIETKSSVSPTNLATKCSSSRKTHQPGNLLQWNLDEPAARRAGGMCGHPGLGRAEIVRYGYAIEYDFAPPHQFNPPWKPSWSPGCTWPGNSTAPRGTKRPPDRMWPGECRTGVAGRAPWSFAATSLPGRDDRRPGDPGVDEPYRMFTSRADTGCCCGTTMPIGD